MGFKPIPAAAALVLTLLIWFVIPIPEGVSPQAWHLLALFVGIIAGIIGKAMPIGAMAILGITLVALTGVTVPELADGEPVKNPAGQAIKDALSSLNNSLIWMIGIAIIISRGLLKTGLGMRIGYLLISLFGKRTLGVGYSLALADLVIGPVTPSNTARGGAIVHPIMKSIALSFDSDPEKGTENKIGKYLSLVNFHANVITCLMFITATAPNPLVVELVAKATHSDIHLSWGTWFLAMLLPGLVAMLLMPLVLYLIFPPEIKQTPNATTLAKEQLAQMGPMKREEKTMLGIFIILLLLWAGVPEMLFGIKVDATATTFLGLSLCLLTGILTWEDALKEKSAWDTIVWFAALVMMANFLNKLGLIGWLSDSLQAGISGMGLGWEAGCALLMLAYLYAHYVFASGTAHVTAMFGAFYGAGLALGAPPMLFALMMAAATGIMMSLTHYATGSAPVIYGSNYTTMTEWWKAGFIMSVLELLIFATVGLAWWNILGYW
ncbi:DASS family sodium-coupled anion symporter [Neisseria animalis]|uniref:DASS family sodium-coupled anion symporter n=1 Tax=Neisseria animalis TaxID=492 RepID=A0A5P3MU36_NEIAN|nr:DASS family sodium-coupled anion symporter [Neisseria animalis]QEY24281.1 DASS family sodium-coupled anion symporter [Neisseria animalis]ROW32314.1 DASS family sodium-coupled anion symporter [Neisseria animalis]VEE06685.1 integral membrane transport protein [Neisseria animalis]